MKYYMDEKAIFHGLMTKEITFEELREGHLVLGQCKDIMFAEDICPCYLSNYNIVLPKVIADVGENITSGQIEKPIFESWVAFRTLVKDSAKSGKCDFTNGIDYPSKALPLLNNNHQVYFGSRQVHGSELKYLTA